jgi:glycosyltransferase involved in cell wall biosynthesis
VRDIWGIHDFIPDYDKLTAAQHTRVISGDISGVPGHPSGCGYYRITQPFDALNGLGRDCAYAAGEPPGDPREQAVAKVIVAQRMDKHAALPHWRRWRAWQRLVYEIDDNVFDVDITNWMAYGAYGKDDVRDAVEQAAACADVVTVTTEPLAAIMRKFSRDVRIIPNVVDDRVLGIDRPRQPNVVVGWQGGASHARDVALVAPALRHVLDKHRKRAELHIIGTDYRDTVGRDGRFTQWIPVDSSLAYYRSCDFDIGLAPLSGTRFDQSKSAIKAIEYNALGIPVLASDCDPYRDFVQDGVNGYLIRRKGDWGRRLEELICDDAARAEMGAKGREIVRAAHTMSTGIKRWQAVYEELM